LKIRKALPEKLKTSSSKLFSTKFLAVSSFSSLISFSEHGLFSLSGRVHLFALQQLTLSAASMWLSEHSFTAK
jgi:hypothetical protein